MATYYSSCYKQNPLRSTLWEAIGAPVEHAGIVYRQHFIATLPVGFTAADVLKLVPFQTAVTTTSPQIAGIKVARAVLTSSGNAGGSVTANFGFAVAPTAYGSALTTLQSANTLDVAIATIQAGPILLANDDLQLVGVANTTTTLQTLTGFIDYSMTAP